jgi:phosphoribosylamine-glycine ligase
MKIAVIGSGGREHALSWKISQSKSVSKVYVIPGNGGTQKGNVVNVDREMTHEELLDFVIKESIELVVVGPEQPLVDGLSDKMKQRGIKCFGPNQKAARLEGSKAFAKQFMEKYDIPTAPFEVS